MKQGVGVTPLFTVFHVCHYLFVIGARGTRRRTQNREKTFVTGLTGFELETNHG